MDTLFCRITVKLSYRSEWKKIGNRKHIMNEGNIFHMYFWKK